VSSSGLISSSTGSRAASNSSKVMILSNIQSLSFLDGVLLHACTIIPTSPLSCSKTLLFVRFYFTNLPICMQSASCILCNAFDLFMSSVSASLQSPSTIFC
jgi:hypothetical protein